MSSWKTCAKIHGLTRKNGVDFGRGMIFRRLTALEPARTRATAVATGSTGSKSAVISTEITANIEVTWYSSTSELLGSVL